MGGFLFGLAPITRTPLKGVAAALKEAAARGATHTAHHLRNGLVVAEIALTVMLVICAGLLVRTVYNLTNVDAGFDRSRLVTFSMTLPQSNYTEPSTRLQAYQRLLGQLRALPGVESVSAMSGLPPDRPLNANDTDIDNYTAPPEGPYENVDYYQHVMSDYFETMGIPIIAGRSFEPTDAASTGRIAIVNEMLVNTYWPDEDSIGQRLRPCCREVWFTVVGVAKDVKQGGIDQETGTEMYFLLEQAIPLMPDTMNVVLRTTVPPLVLSQTIERIVREVDRTVPVVQFQQMDAVFADSIRRPRLLAELVGVFAGLALLLAAIGTYGVLSYSVAERRREIGIRLALGANRWSVLARVMKQGLLLTAIGLAAGLVGALALNRLIASLLFGVDPVDITMLVSVAATIMLVATAACWLPARRASEMDPNVALRDE